MNEKKCIELINTICEILQPGKKTLQKLLYLVERKGINLGLNYKIHFFGPYSSNLDDYLHDFESTGLININTSSRTHSITVVDKSKIECVLEQKELEIAKAIIETFSKLKPLELEALTTIDYVANNIVKEANENKVIGKVKEIKGTKFNDAFLVEQYNLLKELNFLN